MITKSFSRLPSCRRYSLRPVGLKKEVGPYEQATDGLVRTDGGRIGSRVAAATDMHGLTEWEDG